MKIKEFPEQNGIIGEGQEDVFIPIPVNMNEGDMAIPATFCFEVEEEDLKAINEKKEIWITVLTFGQGFHPLSIHSTKPEFPVVTQFGERLPQPIAEVDFEELPEQSHCGCDSCKEEEGGAKC